MDKNNIVIFITTLFVLSILFDGKNLSAEDNIKSSVSEQNSIVDQLLNHLEANPPEENPSKHFSLSNEINSFGLDNQNIAEQEQEYDDDALSSQEMTIIPVLDLQNTDIQGAIDILNEKSVLNFSCEVDAKPYLLKPVDLYLENIKIGEALKIILEPHDLAFVLEKRTVKIMTSDAFFRRYKHPFAETMKTRIIPIHYRDVIKLGEDLSALKGPEGKVFVDNKTKAIVLLGTPDDLIKMRQFIAEQDIPLQTKVFLLENVTVKDIKDQIEKFLTKNVGQLEYDINANKIILTDTVERLQEVQSFIQQVDKPIEVLLESKIIQVQLSPEKIKGVDWEAIVTHYHNFDSGHPEQIQQTHGLSVGTISRDDYLVLLEALETVGEVNVISSPNTTVANRKDVYLQLRSHQGGTTVTMMTSPTKKDVVVPKHTILKNIDEEFYITPQVRSALPMTISISPRNHDHSAKAELEVQEGDVIVVGGMFRDQQVSSVKKFPLLGDLPLLGVAFRTQGTKRVRLEYIVFLMPQISPDARK